MAFACLATNSDEKESPFTMKISPLVATIVLGLAGNAAKAQTIDLTNWYVAPSVSVVNNDSHRTKDIGVGAGLALGKMLNDRWNVEFSAQYLQLDGIPDEQGNIGVDGLYFLNRNPNFAPYLTLGLAYAIEGSTNDDSKNGNLMGKAGIGFTKKLTNKMDFRTDVRYQWHGNKARHSNTDRLGDWVVSFGLNIHLDK